MGYNTDFRGSLEITPPLISTQIDYINLFSETRRMGRNPEILQEMYHGEHGFDGGYGPQGAYFAFDDGVMGQLEDNSIKDFNSSGEAPGLWCQWAISEDGAQLEWSGGEKFYNYTEWLQFLITHFFTVWDVKLNGVIEWRGEDWDDTGSINVIDNVVFLK